MGAATSAGSRTQAGCKWMPTAALAVAAFSHAYIWVHFYEGAEQRNSVAVAEPAEIFQNRGRFLDWGRITACMDDQKPQFELTESGFLALLVKHEPALRGYARGLVPDWDLVDEALQEASVTMWQKRDQLESADGFVPWARVILRFKCLRQLEKLRSRRPLLSDEMLETLAERAESRSVEDSTARGRALHCCLDQFSAEHRELLLAPHSSTHTIVDLAQRRNKSANSLYKLLARLREQLTDCIRLRIAAEA